MNTGAGRKAVRNKTQSEARRQREKLKADLRIKFGSLEALATAHDYKPSAISVALLRPWPNVEQIIAEALGTKPWLLWPERYSDRRPKGGHRARD